MRRIILVAAVALVWFQASASAASITASAVLSSAPDGSNFDYTLKLTNSASSGSGIGTFWSAWVPGEDFLAASPVATNPTGWTSMITHFPDVSTNGFAIQWTTGSDSSAANVAPGASLVFKFTSSDTPAELAGNSIFYPNTPVSTFFVYPGAPFSDAGHQFVASSVPEPATIVLVLSTLPLAALARKLRRRVR
jgi:hypothetical protein